jgi:hypothetical protein
MLAPLMVHIFLEMVLLSGSGDIIFGLGITQQIYIWGIGALTIGKQSTDSVHA